MKIKQKMVRILTGILTMILVLSSITFVSAVDKEEEIDKLIEAQARSVEANEVLMQYFFVEGRGIVYPDYFAGRYIEDNIFHIRLAAPTDEELAGLKNLLSGYEDVVVYEYGDFSRTVLQNYADQTAYVLKKEGISVTNWCVDDKTSDIIIGVLPDDINLANTIIEKMEIYSERMNPPIVNIEQGEYVSTTSGITGGTAAYVGNYVRTLGICGYYEGYPAVVTCGHGTSDAYIGASIEVDDVPIGNFSVIQYESGGIGDYSIIRLNNNYADKMSHKIGSDTHGYTTVNGYYASPSVGMHVKRYGKRSGYSEGEITYTNYTLTTVDGITIHDTTAVVLFKGEGSQGGDSGGPYLTDLRFCGVHIGNNTYNNNYTYFTPYSVLLSAGFTALTAHNCTQWTNANGSFHSGYCSICKEIVYEAHSESWNHILGRCTRCGRTGQVPFDP